MAFAIKNEYEIELERIEEAERREYESKQKREEREHEYRLHKLEHATRTRHEAIRQGIVAIIKGPAILAVALWIPILILARREVPEQLYQFINLSS